MKLQTLPFIFMTAATLATIAVTASIAQAAPAGDTCSIDASEQSCGGGSVVWDDGCSVTCGNNQKASCQEASSLPEFDQNGRVVSCQLIASTCDCE